MANQLDRFNQLRKFDAPSQFVPSSSSTDSAIAQFDSMRQQALASVLNQFQQEKAKREAEQATQEAPTPEQPGQSQNYDFTTPVSNESAQVSGGQQSGIMPTKAPLTQRFGNRSSVESFSKGVNLGADFGIKENTPVALPPGRWQITKVFSGAKAGNRTANSGSGNLVKAVNLDTNETLAFEHLNSVKIGNGQVVKGGTVVGLTGNTGNSTGPHLSIPYTDPQGRYRDILNSPYAKYLFGS